MKRLTGKTIADLVDGLVHAETQEGLETVYLTVDAIHELDGAGSLDFGGSEERKALTEEVEPVKRDDGDDYGWWELEEGSYRVALNESVRLPDDAVGVVQPAERLRRNGATHDTRVVTRVDEGLTVVLQVPENGLELKENARISELRVFK